MVSTHSHDSSLGWCHCAYMTSVFMNERDGMRGTDANSEFWFIARRTDDPSFAPYQDTSCVHAHVGFFLSSAVVCCRYPSPWCIRPLNFKDIVEQSRHRALSFFLGVLTTTTGLVRLLRSAALRCVAAFICARPRSLSKAFRSRGKVKREIKHLLLLPFRNRIFLATALD